MKILALATTKVRGGREFKNEMYNAATCWLEQGHEVTCLEIAEKRPNDIWWLLLEELGHHKTIDCLAVFAHGTTKWIHGVGLNYNTISRLAVQLFFKSTQLVILYSCSCGRSKGEWKFPFRWTLIDKEKTALKVKPEDGVAMVLGAELLKNSVKADIICHASAGHTTRNPYVYRISTMLPHKVVRYPIITRIVGADKKRWPKCTSRWKRWCKALKKTNLRFLFPFMKDTEIIKQLDRGSNDIHTRHETK
jgi:hypothetical protein